MLRTPHHGNVDLSELTIIDTLTDGAGLGLTLTNGPFFSGADLGSGLGTLKVGETASYIAYYTISSAWGLCECKTRYKQKDKMLLLHTLKIKKAPILALKSVINITDTLI